MQSYDLKEQIGRGSFGTCHLAWHRAERRMYVAKRIPVHQVRFPYTGSHTTALAW
jgi:hypothetical protein